MKLFLIGGFLGSGKTTAIQQAAHYLQQQNKKAGVITNDQGTQQVDTGFIKASNIAAEEVAGSCFCCNYTALEKRIHHLRDNNQAEIIFAESVGSCTDLAATIINPLLKFNPGTYDIVLSVFADVRLLLMYLQNNRQMFFEDVTYIFEKQLKEADIIIVNKIDLITPEQLATAKLLIEAAFDDKTILYQNSLEGSSIQTWVDIMLHRFTNNDLRKVLDIDYDIYGAGEAALTWLDEEITIDTEGTSNTVEAADALMQKVYDAVTGQGHVIGHLKFLLNTGTEQRKISFTALYSPTAHNLSGLKANRITVLINARAQVAPDALQKIIDDVIIETEAQFNCIIIVNKHACFIPGYPRPTHRIAG